MIIAVRLVTVDVPAPLLVKLWVLSFCKKLPAVCKLIIPLLSTFLCTSTKVLSAINKVFPADTVKLQALKLPFIEVS